MNARQLITLRLDTPAPSRRQAILAAREAQSQAAAA